MDWRYNTIWFEQIEKGKFHQQNCQIEKKLGENFLCAEYVILWNFRQSGLSFENINESKKLLYLELNRSNIKDFQKIEKLENLRRLELIDCLSLVRDTGICELKNTLEFLQIDNSKRFTFAKNLCELKKLKVLRLYYCAPLKDLKFLEHFPNLLDFRFVGTTIKDGNLKPLMDHPTIKTVSFRDRKHYNYTEKQLKTELMFKSNVEFKEYIYKKGIENYKYK